MYMGFVFLLFFLILGISSVVPHMSEKRLRALVSGRVQGVWFRKYTHQKARKIGTISGWVKNRDDGAVEIVAEGPEEDLKSLVKWLWEEGSPLSKVTDVDVTWSTPEGKFDSFEIRY